MTPRTALAAATALALLGATACRSTPTPTPTPAGRNAGNQGGGQPGARAGGDSAAAGGSQGAPNPRPYARVVTKEAKTRDGLFKTHLVGNRLLFEIPDSALGHDMLLVTQIAKTTLGVGYGGQAVDNRVVRWERRGNRVLLRSVSYNIVADTGAPVYQAVSAANYSPIMAAFNVEAYGPDSAAVIDVSRLFTNPPSEFSPTDRIRGQVDASRSFVERVASFPTNVETEATVTINVPRPQGQNGGGGGGRGNNNDVQPGAASVLMHYSMVRLPDTPMMPRLADERVGFFTVRQIDFSRPEQRAETRTYITRYRLECSDQRVGELCVPKKPITYYVDPATPTRWVPWVKKGIESWQKAFEAAGFSQGIVAKEAPSVEEDPDWSPEDARYSVVRWLPSTIENAVGPHIHDPRSGEIIEADVQFYHNVMNLNRDWYWTQVGAVDPRAATLPLPDSLMGRLVQYVVAHEVGHTLGLQHNMKASSMYPVDSLRSRTWLEKMGHTPTLMDYSRFNYVVQPEDSIPPELLIPRIGPYDDFIIMWGYKPIPNASTPDAERSTLDRWVRMQDTLPWLRFSTADAAGADPGELTEAVGDEDAVQATTLGLKNIKRLVPMLIPATVRPLENYDDLRELYGRLVGQWATEMRHVAAVVGGESSRENYQDVRFTPIPKARQQEAMHFLAENAFATPEYFLRPEILRRIEPAGAIERINNAQTGILNTLLSDSRLNRLVEQEALAERPSDAYTAGAMLTDLRNAVWGELDDRNVRIDPYRRALQRSYLRLIDTKLNPPPRPANAPAPRGPAAPSGPTDARALLRGELKLLDGELREAIARTSDRTTRLHLEDARLEIARILDPSND
ncbi:MAG TPA: zinc-dependent metalloprotease [Gemmatimonadaceae bacterium]|nr:zinc-dependent metalloprotease [Gemmatimonadaceae bacterium]